MMKFALIGLMSTCLFAADPPAPPAPPAAPQRTQGVITAVGKNGISLTVINAGDALDRPSGPKLQLAVTADTKVLDIMGREVKDPKVRAGIVAKGQVVIFKVDKQEYGDFAAMIQAVGG